VRLENEPEFLLPCARAPNQLRRGLRTFKLEHGNEVGHTFDERIGGSSLGFESTLGNPAPSMAQTVIVPTSGPALGALPFELGNTNTLAS